MAGYYDYAAPVWFPAQAIAERNSLADAYNMTAGPGKTYGATSTAAARQLLGGYETIDAVLRGLTRALVTAPATPLPFNSVWGKAGSVLPAVNKSVDFSTNVAASPYLGALPGANLTGTYNGPTTQANGVFNPQILTVALEQPRNLWREIYDAAYAKANSGRQTAYDSAKHDIMLAMAKKGFTGQQAQSGAIRDLDLATSRNTPESFGQKALDFYKSLLDASYASWGNRMRGEYSNILSQETQNGAGTGSASWVSSPGNAPGYWNPLGAEAKSDYERALANATTTVQPMWDQIFKTAVARAQLGTNRSTLQGGAGAGAWVGSLAPASGVYGNSTYGSDLGAYYSNNGVNGS